MNQQELNRILDEHALWLSSDNKEGRRANLPGANLSETDLSRANLIRANLIEADLSGAYLSGVDLSGADLTEAYLSRANLSGANLSDAKFDMNFREVSLFKNVTFSEDQIPWLISHTKWSEFNDSVKIV